MSDMKCPFCNKPLQPTLRQSDEYWCENYDCPRTNIEWVGSQKLWQELIRTRKALDVAVDGLKSAKTRLELINNSKLANLNNVLQIQSQCEVLKIDKALEQINQKEQQ